MVKQTTTAPQANFEYYDNAPFKQYGWVCPVCGAVNAPWKSKCDCAGQIKTDRWVYQPNPYCSVSSTSTPDQPCTTTMQNAEFETPTAISGNTTSVEDFKSKALNS